jgi:hypothetical protein
MRGSVDSRNQGTRIDTDSRRATELGPEFSDTFCRFSYFHTFSSSSRISGTPPWKTR